MILLLYQIVKVQKNYKELISQNIVCNSKKQAENWEEIGFLKIPNPANLITYIHL